MTVNDIRRRLMTSFLLLPLGARAARARGGRANQVSIAKFGAIADGTTINTLAIQSAIDHLAQHGGGTAVIPPGVFMSGALFLKPRVSLHLEKGAVLECSTDLRHFPVGRTRIEGHFEAHFNPGLINADGCDDLQITGEGTLDGAGRPVWDRFWKLRAAAPDPENFPNLSVPRARLAVIQHCRRVLIEGITFKDSQFWNLHLYACDGVTVRNARFEVPDDYAQAPSTDGIDVDSSRNVTIDGCYFSVTDDCIAAKGSKGPQALADVSSPPVQHVRVRNCVFKRGLGVLTLGSEATVVRDVIVENCKVIGAVNVAVLKLRPDTPQQYENIELRNLTLDSSKGSILRVAPWFQYADTQGAAPPNSVVHNIRLIGIRGRFGSLGEIRPNPHQTAISDILLRNLDVRLQDTELKSSGVQQLRIENVIVNGKRM